jgi:hypothetical protein
MGMPEPAATRSERRREVVMSGHQRPRIDEAPADVPYELVAVDDRARIPARHVKLASAAAAVGLIALVGVNLLTAGRIEEGGLAVAPLPPFSTVTGPSPSPSTATSAPESLPLGHLAVGEHQLTVDGFTITFAVPTTGWISSGPRDHGGWIHKGGPAPQDEAAIAIWSPDNVFAQPCNGVPLVPPVGPSAADLAAAMATLPGTEATRPTDVSVGGVNGQYVVLTIREGMACDPAHFRLWYETLGYTSTATGAGSTIRAWIVDGDRALVAPPRPGSTARLVIEGRTNSGASPDLTREIEQVVDSITFCCT